jgi:ParB-like chromosome segregation protein Spo0J
MESFERHELSGLFPDMDAHDYDDLKQSIRDNGQRNPIVLYDNQVLDGWHRFQACLDLGIAPKTEVFFGDPTEFVLDLNLRRRHLTEGQRAMMIVQIAARAKNTDQKKLTQEKMAAIANVSRASVARAASIKNDDVVKEVISGSTSLAQAINVVNGEKKVKKKVKGAETAKKPDYDDLMYDELSKEHDELQDDYEKLQEKYDDLREDYKNLLENHEYLQAEHKVLTDLREVSDVELMVRLQRENDILRKSANSWQEEASKLKRQVMYWRKVYGSSEVSN